MRNMEREAIVTEFDKLKNVVESSSLMYFCEESPYSAKIHLRKKFRNDWSNSSSLHVSTPQLISRPATLTSLSSPPQQQTFSFNESGYQTQNILQRTFHDAAVQKTDVEYDAVKLELLEACQTIVNLKDEIKKKDDLISQAGLNLKKVAEEKDLFKKERDIKGEQLKQKIKNLNESKEKLAQVKEDCDTMKDNYEQK